jgi:hypothetical protein
MERYRWHPTEARTPYSSTGRSAGEGIGGWVTMKDQHDCDSIEEFYEKHGLM